MASRLPDRRAFMAYFSSVGLGSTLLPGVLWARVTAGAEITPASIAAAAELAGLTLDDDERELMVRGLRRQAESLEALHRIPLDNAVAPALRFDPVPAGMAIRADEPRAMVRAPIPMRAAPADPDELAFATVAELSEMVRARQVTSTQLTRMYLARLRRFDPVLQCVITLTETRALEQARVADEEIARGRYRGPLHGIPWGAKDLLAVRGYKTTWGAGPFREQVLDNDATVVRRLDEAGAVLVAKLTLGELAQGDNWFGGITKNPWNVEQGSSGSSAGPASATAAGLVGFSIGSETLGSISSPSTRCGATGLRPTFGRVPRTGAMALSWSMDKLGPLCRGVEDCALVLDAIHGPDDQDLSCRDVPFSWNATAPLADIRVGYLKSAFDAPVTDPANPERTIHATKPFDDAALAALRGLGITLLPVELPEMAYGAMRIILTAEAAAAFDELTRSGRDDLLVQQDAGDWANTFRTARFIPAVDYINANRVRRLALEAWATLFERVDVIVTPTSGSSQLVATNLTGHPAVILPHGFRENGTPVSLTFLGHLYGESALLRVAHAFEQATEWHSRHPVVPV